MLKLGLNVLVLCLFVSLNSDALASDRGLSYLKTLRDKISYLEKELSFDGRYTIHNGVLREIENSGKWEADFLSDILRDEACVGKDLEACLVAQLEELNRWVIELSHVLREEPARDSRRFRVGWTSEFLDTYREMDNHFFTAMASAYFEIVALQHSYFRSLTDARLTQKEKDQRKEDGKKTLKKLQVYADAAAVAWNAMEKFRAEEKLTTQGPWTLVELPELAYRDENDKLRSRIRIGTDRKRGFVRLPYFINSVLQVRHVEIKDLEEPLPESRKRITTRRRLNPVRPRVIYVPAPAPFPFFQEEVIVPAPPPILVPRELSPELIIPPGLGGGRR